MEPQVVIGRRSVGLEHEPFIMAEVGLNHNGELDRALQMIHVAVKAGCDAVKFQTFKAAEFVNDPTQMFTYRSQGHEVTESMLAMFQRYELPETAWPVIKSECDKAGILFLSTPQNRTDLNILEKIGVPAVKVGSDDFTNLPLLKSYAESGLPLILSTGMSDMAEAYQALESVGAFDGYPLILLVCTSQYPTPAEDANLRRIISLRAAFPMIPIGFSDHTTGPLASSIAAALGACLFEKHFTLDQGLPGPDHWFSEDPEGLAAWVNGIRTARKMLGSPLVRPTPAERENKNEFQRRIVAARDIVAGEIFNAAMLTSRRVSGGRGLPPSLLEYFLGRPASQDFQAGAPVEI
jgi:N,N'-diacetyllegionaminate synthase